ncbi:MAG TPA: hypothetical protein VF275_10100 [Gammaproteobacteria bacterium]
MSDPRKIVAYSDLLGFSELVVKDRAAATQLLSDFYNLAQRTKADTRFQDLELFLFSDFLFVQGSAVEEVANYMCILYRKALRYTDRSPAAMLIRGGIARGGVFSQERHEAPNVTKNFIVSSALTHAVKMESLVKGQRLLISAKEREEIDHFYNAQINAVCYDQPSLKPSKLFKKYRYQDLLWARDISLARAAAREEATECIRIASQLFRNNFGNKSIVLHYAETLRITLLSYSGLLEPTDVDQGFVAEFVSDTLLPFPNSTVWLGFLESVLMAPEGRAFYLNQGLMAFLRQAILINQWGEVSAALQQPEHAQLLERVQEFVSLAID